MSFSLASAEALVNEGKYAQAANALGNLRTNIQSTIEALMLWSRIHAAQRHWVNVDVVCKVIRQDYPRETFGFAQGAESLHQQGRSREAVELLKECEADMTVNPTLLYNLARYHCAIDNLLGATLLLGTAFSRDLTLRDKAFSDGDLRKVWAQLQETEIAPPTADALLNVTAE